MPTTTDIIKAYQTYLGRTPSQAEIQSYLNDPNYAMSIQNSVEAQNYAVAKAGGQQALDAYLQQAGIAPSSFNGGTTTSTGTASGSAPSYVNLSDPVQAAVWNAYSQKGIAPSSQSDFQYWVDKINTTNGGWTNPQNQQYWLSRMAQSSGGVGDYGGGGSTGLSSLAGIGSINTPPPATLSSLPSWGQPYTGAFVPPSTNVGSLPSWAQPYDKQFTLPTAAEVQQTPGFQFALQQGIQGIDRGAAARGTLDTGGTIKAEQEYGTGLASQYYQNAVNNALQQFGTNYGVYQGNQNAAANAYQQMYGNALSGYNTNLNTYLANQGLASNAYQQLFNNWNTVGSNLFNRTYSLATLGK